MPMVPLVTIFLPIWLVGWVSLAIFFQETGFEGRIANLAAVMLAYVAFMPVVRDQLPQNPKLTFI